MMREEFTPIRPVTGVGSTSFLEIDPEM